MLITARQKIHVLFLLLLQLKIKIASRFVVCINKTISNIAITRDLSRFYILFSLRSGYYFHYTFTGSRNLHLTQVKETCTNKSQTANY